MRDMIKRFCMAVALSAITILPVTTLAATIQYPGSGTYITLQKAFNAAASGDTIELTAAVTESAKFTGKSITFDLAGNTISGTSPLFQLGSGAELIITDSTGVNPAVTATGGTVVTIAGVASGVTVENGTFSGTLVGFAPAAVEEALDYNDDTDIEAEIFIDNGVFSLGSGVALVDASTGAYQGQTPTGISTVITGGTFSSDPSAYNAIPTDAVNGYYAVTQVPGGYQVLPAVATDGTSYYVNLTDAVAGTAANGTITLIDNDTVSFANGGVAINKNLTIDGAGYTITGVSDAGSGNVGSPSEINDSTVHGFYIKGGDVTIKNVTLTQFGDTDYVNKFGYTPVLTSTSYTGKLTLQNVNIDKFNRQAICAFGGTLTVTGGTITANAENKGTGFDQFQQPIEVRGSTTATIDGVTITGGKSNLSYSGGAIVAFPGSTATVNNVNIDYTGIGVWSDTATVTVTGSGTTITATDKVVFVEEAGTANITDGTYNGTLGVDSDTNSTIAVSGGKFSTRVPDAFCADNATSNAEPGADGYYTLGHAVATVTAGDPATVTKYTTLQGAIDAAHEMTGDVTIKLVDDYAGYVIVHQKAGLNLTIDGQDKARTITGQIIVDGDGRASGTETLTISGIKFTGNTENFYTGLDAFIQVPSTKTAGTPYYTNKYNYAHNITVDNCSFTSTSSAFDVVGLKVNSGAGAYSVAIKDSEAKNLHSLVQFQGTKDATIKDNKVEDCENGVGVQGGEGTYTFSGNDFSVNTTSGYGIRLSKATTVVAELSDNTITAKNALALGKDVETTNQGKFVVESGYYNGGLAKITTSSDATFTITGGYFTEAFPYDYIPADSGLIRTKTTVDNVVYYTVKEGTYVAQVGADMFETFDEAVTAAAGSETIVLLEDIEGNYELSNGQTLIVNANGKNFKVVKSSALVDSAEHVYSLKTVTNGDIKTYTISDLPAVYSYTTVSGVTTYKTSFSGTAVSGSGTYKLLTDVAVTVRLVPGIMASDVVFDLNGHTFTSSAQDYAILLSRDGSASSHKTFAIVDTSANKGGKIIATGLNPADSTDAMISATGKYNDITIGEGVTLQGGAVAILSENQTLTVNGTINGGNDFALVTNGSSTKDATITINEGAVLTSTITAVYLPAGELTINGGSITGATAVYVKSGTLNVTGGTLTGNGAKADYTYNGNGCNATGDALVIDNCGYPNGEPVVSITGGTFISENATAVKSYAYGSSGEEDRVPLAGFIAATVDGQNNPAQFSDNESDGVPVGYELVAVENSNPLMYQVLEYPAIQYYNTWSVPNVYYFDDEDPIPVRTTQGTIPTIKRTGESSYHPVEDWVQISWTVTSSSATDASTPDNSIATVDNTGLVTFTQPGTVKVWLTMTDPSGATKSSSKTVKYDLAPAYVVSSDGQTKTAYGSLFGAFNAAQDGETVVLGKDGTGNNISKMTLNADKAITLDLHGNTFTFSANYRTDSFGAFITVKKGSLTVVDTGAEKGGIVVSGTNARAFNMDCEANDSADDAVLTIGEGVNVSSASDCCVTLFGKSTLNTAGNLSSPDDFAIAGNGSAQYEGTVINVTGGTITSGSVAIYNPQDGELNISGGTITGTTAVYVKSGTISVSGGELVGTGDKVPYTYYGNGCYATGDALVVDNCSYPGGVSSVEITGGTFSSDNGYGIGSYYGNGVTTLATVTATTNTIIVPENEMWVENDPSGYKLVEAVVVTFDTVGGTEIASQKIEVGTRATEPTPVSELEGYLFNAWTLDGAVYNFNDPVTESITLTATWKRVITSEMINVPTGAVYNGQPWEITSVTDGDAILINPNDYAVAYEDNVYAGTATVTVTGAGSYTGEATATFDIAAKPVSVTVSSTSSSAEYSGVEKSFTPVITYTSDEDSDSVLFDDDKVTFSGTEVLKRTVIGTTQQSLASDQFGYTDTNLSVTFTVDEDGAFTVTQKALTITADSDTKVYDGTELTKDSYTSTDLATGDTIDSVTATGSQTTVGESENVPSAAVIKNGTGDDVTDCYDITYANGTLTVTKATLTITAESAEKLYDGTALTATGYTSEGLATGDTVTSVTVTGSQTEPGESANVPSAAVIKNGAGDDVTACYEITYANGTLTIVGPTASATVTVDGTVTEKYFATVQAALNAVDLDGTVTLLQDVEEYPLYATTACTLDLNGFALTGVIEPDFDFTVVDTYVDPETEATNLGTIQLPTLADGETIDGDTSVDGAIWAWDGATVTISGGTYANPAVVLWTEGANVVINGGVFETYAVVPDAENCAAATRKNRWDVDAVITVTDGEFNGSYIIGTHQYAKGATLNIEGGWFKAADAWSQQTIDNEGVSVSGGYFAQEPVYLAEGYVAAANTDEDTNDVYPYTVNEVLRTATITKIEVHDLTQSANVTVALNNWKSGTLVKLWAKVDYNDAYWAQVDEKTAYVNEEVNEVTFFNVPVSYNTVYTATGEDTISGAFDRGANVVGTLAVTLASSEDCVVGVPYSGIGEFDTITVAELFQTTTLEDGDMVYTLSNEYVWNASTGTWEADDEDNIDQLVPGSAVVFYRRGGGMVRINGEVKAWTEKQPWEEDEAAWADSLDSDDGWNMVASVNPTALNVQDIPYVGLGDDDSLWITDSTGIFRELRWDGSQWYYSKKVYAGWDVTVTKVTDLTIAAGSAFWYVNND